MSTNRPMFSVVIPTRNRPDLANATLARALQQTWRDLEIIVLDRIHVMGYLGPWSTGYATETQGQQGAAARYAAEIATDPIATAGLEMVPPCIKGLCTGRLDVRWSLGYHRVPGVFFDSVVSLGLCVCFNCVCCRSLSIDW
jgi:cellulose synthase/poly-beta-1,6-N-acetylglucosamine synthase-like glycosyltransferase